MPHLTKPPMQQQRMPQSKIMVWSGVHPPGAVVDHAPVPHNIDVKMVDVKEGKAMCVHITQA